MEDAIYRERARLVAFLAAVYPSVLLDDPGEPSWSIVYVQTPRGQLSWHIAAADLDLFCHVESGPATWDGHTTDEKYVRLCELVTLVSSSN